MMVCNDLSFANALLGRIHDKSLSLPEQLHRGGGMYCIRLQIGHLNEALGIIGELRENEVLSGAVERCSDHAQSSFKRLTACLNGGSDRKKFLSAVEMVRHKTIFHYDRKLVQKAIVERAARSKRELHTVTASNDVRAVRFGVADDILDTLTCRQIWKAKGSDSETVQAEIEEMLDVARELSIALLEFGSEFIMRYVKWNAAL